MSEAGSFIGSGGDVPNNQKVEAMLQENRETFGHQKGFREGQKDIILHAVNGKDVSMLTRVY
jgi:hypothetical protein